MTYFSQIPKMDTIELCVVCHENPAIDWDHALFSGPRLNKKHRTKVWREFLDDPFNIRAACLVCNRTKRTADTYWSRFTHVHNMMQQDPDKFKAWFETYPGSRKPGSRWFEIEKMIDAIEGLTKETED